MYTHSILTISNAYGMFVKNILLFTRMKPKNNTKVGTMSYCSLP